MYRVYIRLNNKVINPLFQGVHCFTSYDLRYFAFHYQTIPCLKLTQLVPEVYHFRIAQNIVQNGKQRFEVTKTTHFDDLSHFSTSNNLLRLSVSSTIISESPQLGCSPGYLSCKVKSLGQSQRILLGQVLFRVLL